MAKIMMMLRREHANMAALITTLENQITLFEEAKAPDYDIVEAIIDYFLDYPDLYHHPKEDLIYARLKALNPMLAEQVGDLLQQHKELHARTREFAAGVRAVLDEAQVPRESFLRWANGFIALQWQHMQMEEQHIFPAALSTLGEADWAELDAQLEVPYDPVFGDRAGVGSERYEHLRQNILRWAADPGSA